MPAMLLVKAAPSAAPDTALKNINSHSDLMCMANSEPHTPTKNTIIDQRCMANLSRPRVMCMANSEPHTPTKNTIMDQRCMANLSRPRVMIAPKITGTMNET